jgi:hypothetical protein
MIAAASSALGGSGSVWLADGAIANAARVDPEMTPSNGLLQGGTDDVMHLSDGATTERSALMTRATPAAAEVTAALQSCVQALEQLGVQLPGDEVAECWPDVETDEVVVPVARGVFELRDVEPPVDCLAERDVRGVGLQGLADVPGLLGQRVGPGVDDDLEAAGRQLPDVPSWAPTFRGWNAMSL